MSVSAGAGSFDFGQAMEAVARQILGKPTEVNKSKRELRWGTRGSLSISLDKGTWFDHEASKGGGVIDFVRERQRLDSSGALAWLLDNGHIPKSVPKPKPKPKRQVAQYDYHDEGGDLLYQVVRFDPKGFNQRKPDGRGGWDWKMDGVRRVLFRLPLVIAAVAAGRTIYIVEGEKAVQSLESIGLVGTNPPGGAGKWRAEYNQVLVGADVVVLSDNDPPAIDRDGKPRFHPDGQPILPGQDHAAQVARSLSGIAARVRVVMLPGLPPKGDVADWVANGGTREGLDEIAAGVAEFDASPKFKPDAAEPEPDIDRPGNQEAFAAQCSSDPVAAVMAEFNDRYMVVNETGKAIIYELARDPVLNRSHFTRITFEDLRRLYLNRRIPVGRDRDGEAIMKPVADVWLSHPDRRQCIGGVVFDPTNHKIPADILNLWRGFAVQSRPGEWTLMQDHILRVICNGNREHFDWLMGWMARLVQRPAEQGEVAVVMRGIEGSGKGTLAKALLHIFGQHGLAVSNAKHLTGNFNGHLRDTVLLFADEAFFAGDKAHVGVLKALITEPFLTIEAKYQNAVQMPNFVHLMMASNEDWVVPASLEARRFFVLDVSPARANDHAYFAAILGEMDTGGYEAMLHDLSAYDLTFFNHRAAPKTAGLQNQKKLSLPAAEDWWSETLYRGYVFKSRLGLDDHFGQWHEQMATDILFDAYCAFARVRGERHPMGREAFGKFMATMGAQGTRMRGAVVGEAITDVADEWGSIKRKANLIKLNRAHGYKLSSLSAAREAFERKTGLKIEWPGDADDPPS